MMILYKWTRRLIYVFALCGVLAWCILLSRVCWFPIVADDHYTVAYDCHGKTVYITPAQDLFIHWFVPVFMVLAIIYQYAERRLRAPREV